MGMLGSSGMRMPGLGSAVQTGPKMAWMQWGAPQASPVPDPGDPPIKKQPPDPTGGSPGAAPYGLGNLMHAPLTLTGDNAVQITPHSLGFGSGTPNMAAPETLSGAPDSMATPYRGTQAPVTLDGVNIPGAVDTPATPAAAAASPSLLSRLSQLLGLL